MSARPSRGSRLARIDGCRNRRVNTELRSAVCATLIAAAGMLVVSAAVADGFSLHPTPVLETRAKGTWDAGEIDPGAVVYHDGRFHMFFNGLRSYPMTYSTGYATSPDGMTWKRESLDPVLTLEATGFAGENFVANSALVTDDGQWVLYVSISPHDRDYMGIIARATAASPLGPWRVDSDPVLQPGPKGSWDAKAVGHANVVKDGADYVMYYIGVGSIPAGVVFEQRAAVGLARSSDGIHWEKHDDPATTDPVYAHSDPVLEAAAEGWDNSQLTDPNVQRTGDTWTMIYRAGTTTAYADMGLATSDDGVRWQRASNNPFLTRKDVNEGGIFFTNYLHRDGRDYIWFEAGWINAVRIYLLTRP